MEKDRKEPANAEGASLLFQNVYCVCFPQRDSLEALQGELATARKRFFASGRKTVKVGRHEIVKGFDGDLRGKISRRGFYWKKTALAVSGQKGVALEEAFGQKGGYVLVNRDFRGLIVSRVFFDKELAWQKSEYYEPWDPVTAKVMFKPDPMEDTVGRYDWDPDKKLYRSVILHPAPYQAGSAEQALVNARFGEPPLIVAAGDGQLCYCPQKEAEARAQALEEISSGTMVLMPAWEIKEGAFLGDEGEEDAAVTFTSLEEYARVEKEEKPAPPVQSPPPPIPAQARDIPEPEFTLGEEELARVDELDIEFILADARQEEFSEPPVQEPLPPTPPEPAPAVWEENLNAAQEPPERTAPTIEDSAVLPVVREAMEQNTAAEAPRQEAPGEAGGPVYEEDEPAGFSPAQHPVPAEPPKRAAQGGSGQAGAGLEDASILSAARLANAAEAPPQGRHSAERRHGPETEDTSILSAARQASGAGQPRRAKHSSPARPAMGEEDASILSAARQAGRTEPPRQAGAQRHMQKNGPVVPKHAGAEPPPPPPPEPPVQKARKPAPPAVPDRMRAGKLSGKGRAEQPGGLTAYEGDYKDGKRQGFGSHYYKNGDLSYAGFWHDDKKDGLGVSFREGDHALHISRWTEGRPGQQVSLFDKEGSLRFGGRIVNGKKEGAGVSISSVDGSVLVTKWAGGQNTGLASAFDPEGNLLYYGSWKNGKRHGHGTEFDKNGGIVFDGEWRDDQYFNGILYQKPAEEPLPADPGHMEPDWDM